MPNLWGVCLVGGGEGDRRTWHRWSAGAVRVGGASISGSQWRRSGKEGWRLARETTHGRRTGGTNSKKQPAKRESLGSPPMASAGQRCQEIGSSRILGVGRCGRGEHSQGVANVKCQHAVMGKYDGTPRDSLIEEGRWALVNRSRSNLETPSE